MTLKINKQVVFYVLAGVVLYLYFMLTHIPASFVLQQMSRDKPLPISYAGVSGTLWSGRLSQLSVQQVMAGDLDWKLSMIPVLWGQLSLQLSSRADQDVFSARASISSGQVEMDEVSLRFDLSRLMPLLYGWPIGLDGQINGQFKHLAIQQSGQLSIEGQVRLVDLALTAPQALSLGSFNLRAETAKNITRLFINDEKGPLSVEGVIEIQDKGQYSLKATVTPKSTTQPELQNALKLLGRPDNQGRYLLRRQGTLPLQWQ